MRLDTDITEEAVEAHLTRGLSAVEECDIDLLRDNGLVDGLAVCKQAFNTALCAKSVGYEPMAINLVAAQMRASGKSDIAHWRTRLTVDTLRMMSPTSQARMAKIAARMDSKTTLRLEKTKERFGVNAQVPAITPTNTPWLKRGKDYSVSIGLATNLTEEEYSQHTTQADAATGTSRRRARGFKSKPSSNSSTQNLSAHRRSKSKDSDTSSQPATPNADSAAQADAPSGALSLMSKPHISAQRQEIKTAQMEAVKKTGLTGNHKDRDLSARVGNMTATKLKKKLLKGSTSGAGSANSTARDTGSIKASSAPKDLVDPEQLTRRRASLSSTQELAYTAPDTVYAPQPPPRTPNAAKKGAEAAAIAAANLNSARLPRR